MTDAGADPMGIAGRLVGGGHELVQRVYYEDTDLSGRVYHARYLHFMERGRSDYLRLLGVGHRDLAVGGIAFVVRRMEVDFLASAEIDDLLTILTRPAGLGGARILLRQEILRTQKPLVSSRVTLALVGSKGRAVRLPPAISVALACPPSAEAADP